MSLLTILELQRGDAFLIPGSGSPVQRNKPSRYPVGFTTTFKPESSIARSRLLARHATVVEGAKQSVLGKACAVLAPLLVTLRNAAAPAMAVAMANEWPLNLVKHVLTIFVVRFMVSTFLDMSRATKFQWTKLPRYLSTAGLVVAGALWIDSIFLVPYYVISLIKHVFCMWGVVSVVSFIRSRLPKKAPTTVTKAVAEPVPPPPKSVPSPPAGVGVEEEEEEEPPVAAPKIEEEEKEEPLVETKATTSDDEAITTEEKVVEKVENVVKDGLYYLANIQEELAELQLKRIPEIFSRETYDRAQERITKFQSEKVLDFFKGDDEEKEK